MKQAIPYERFAGFWKQAAFLDERLLAKNGSGSPASVAEADLDMAYQKLQKWQEGMLADDKLFAERLRASGLTKEQFLILLADRSASQGVTPEALYWTEIINDLRAGLCKDEPLPEISVINPAQPNAGPHPLPFGSFVRPFLQIGAYRLRKGVASILRRFNLDVFYTPNAETELLQNLAQRLLTQCSRTLILELNVARLRGILQGQTPEERYTYFAEHYFQDTQRIVDLLTEYPVLARLMSTTVLRWVKAVLEFLERIANDRRLLSEVFQFGQPVGLVRSVRMGISDPHRGGRGVIHVIFDSGLEVIYKPKSMAVDSKFQNLLAFLNEKGTRYPFRMLKVLDRGEYGWMEYVRAHGCHNREELHRFYWRQGGYLALLYLLKAVDFHFENLIAAGEYPVLIDLEGLFHHDKPAPSEWTAYELAGRILDQSVLRVGLLPMKVYGREGLKGVDLSGLGGPDGQVFPRKVPLPRDAFTDKMRIEPGEVVMGGGQNRPQLKGQLVDPLQFQDDIIQGFEEVYHLLQNHRDELLPILDAFAQTEVRHILRGTMRYTLFLQEGHHPDYLRNGLDRDELLDKLWAETTLAPHLKRAIPSEQADLRLGDIPYFTARPGERHLWDSRGQCLENFFDNPSLEDVKERLRKLSVEDCAEQVRLIRASMVSIDRHRTFNRRPIVLPSKPDPVTKDRFLGAAIKIGEYLASRAIRTEKDACWIGVNLEGLDHWQWVLNPVGTSLYEGTAGIALFFAYLASATNRTDFENLARLAIEPVRKHLSLPDVPGYGNLGAFSGRASLIYTMMHLAVLWQEPKLLDEVFMSLDELERHIPVDEYLDLLSGVAGCAVVLLDLYQATGEKQALRLARMCGDRLLATFIPMEKKGIGWKVKAASRPLAGFSHGASGICWALLKLAAATGDERYHHAALEGLAYERSLFKAERGNWADLRYVENGPTVDPEFIPCTWCHGAPGIVLGRLLGLTYLDDSMVKSEIVVGLETTLREGFGDNHCLCHGDLGNAEVLLQASRVLKEDSWQHAAYRVAQEVTHQVEIGQPRCGLPKGTETPGLMLGLAGIGMGLLRFWSPDRIPSILCLEPPSIQQQ